jgi:hypothetical protein
MDEAMVDGNAIAGTLAEVFVQEMTSVRIVCDGCGKVEPLGADHAYVLAPGVVLRCRHCNQVLLALSQAAGRSFLSLRGSRWIELPAEP